MILNFCCSDRNDLYALLTRDGAPCPRFDRPEDAIRYAPPGSGVLLLGDNPEAPLRLDAALLATANARGLRLYVEASESLPGLESGAPVAAEWERVVVASDVFGPSLSVGRILAVSGCRYTPVAAVSPWLVLARVAGYDNAVFGIPASAVPLLFEDAGRGLLIATTPLSPFITGRYGPAADWGTVWKRILSWLDPERPARRLSWVPIVHPAYGPDEPLPDDAEGRALESGAAWVFRSRLLPTPERYAEVASLLRAGTEAASVPDPGQPDGDGSCGVQEGYASAIQSDGNQWQRLPIRADCQAETAMVLAIDASVHGTERGREAAEKILRFLYVTSGLHGGPRGNPEHPAYGLISWGALAAVWDIANYGDDNARALLATMLASACLGTDAWDASMLRALLANLRTTGKLGFRGNRIDMPDLERNGWRAYSDSEVVNPAPHYEAYMWACFLWAFRQTGHRPFLESAKSGVRRTMEVYPDDWKLQDNSERAQMLLPLSWLYRLEATDEVRGWIQRVAGDLIACQQPCGALPERLAGGDAMYGIPVSNEAYGTGETPLIQQNGDPVSDQLYTSGFALLGLHEAAAALDDADLRAAEDRLAAYLCRIQVRSERLPYLHGAFFRAFDFQRWDYWASSADSGWGAWCIESGWGQAWIAAVFGLRQMDTTLWERTDGSRIASQMDVVQEEMARNSGGPWTGPAWGAWS